MHLIQQAILFIREDIVQRQEKQPISECLAAALIKLTPWNKDRILIDPFCGSGTFPIEAAMIAANIAPGLNRDFTAESWSGIIPKKEWYEAVTEANDMVNTNIETDIQGYDLDGDVIKIARRNAENAGVANLIHFQQRDVAKLSPPKKYGLLLLTRHMANVLRKKRHFLQYIVL